MQIEAGIIIDSYDCLGLGLDNPDGDIINRIGDDFGRLPGSMATEMLSRQFWSEHLIPARP